MAGPLTTSILTDVAALAAERTAWDALAVAASRPYCAPGWALPWWEHARPADAELRAIAVRSGDELVGLAPFFVTRDRFGITTWRLLADDAASYIEPLASPPLRAEVGEAIVAALRSADRPVDVLTFAFVPQSGGWADELRAHWVAPRPARALVWNKVAPYVDLPGGFDAWMAGLSAKTRKNFRAAQREFDRNGGVCHRATTPVEVEAGLDAFIRLHHDRWRERGGSMALSPAIEAMLRGAGRDLDPSRFQVWTATIEGEAAGSAILVGAGDELHGWLAGFAEKWARCSPFLVVTVAAIREAAEQGVRKVSLGPGTSMLKDRLATGRDELETVDLIPVGLRFPYVQLCQSPHRLYRLASNRTPPAMKERLRSLRTPSSSQ